MKTLTDLVTEKENALRDALNVCINARKAALGTTPEDVKRSFLVALHNDYNNLVVKQNGLPRSTTNTDLGASLQAVKNMIRELEGHTR